VVVVVVVVVGGCVGWNLLLPKAKRFAVLNLEAPPAVENLEDGEVGATVVVGSGRLKDVRRPGLSVMTSNRDGLFVV